jgi:hypothetical protein
MHCPPGRGPFAFLPPPLQPRMRNVVIQPSPQAIEYLALNAE